MGYKFDRAEEGPVAEDIYRDHVGVHRQKQDGLSYVGATILNGRLTADQMFALAELSERYGDGHLRTTIGQNILIVNVPNAKTQELVKELDGAWAGG